MHFPVEGTRKTLLFFTVLTSLVINFGEIVGEKTINLRIGFDLTQGKNGAPALRIRDFEESLDNERYPRAADDDASTGNQRLAVRADSFSESKEDKGQDEESTKERQESSEMEDGGYDSDGKARHKSTKGMNPEDFEPEENGQIHKFDEDDRSDAEVRRYRLKRHAENESEKRKGKKFTSGRKQGVTRPYRRM